MLWIRILAQRVIALRGAGADVWFDEHNLGAQQLLTEIQRQLAGRPVFVVLLSPAAFASEWVRDECTWAWNIQKRDPSHVLLPVVIAPIEPSAFNSMLYLETYKRVATGGYHPLAEDQMLAETLRLLALTPGGQAPTAVTPAPTESVNDLLTQGNALAAQQRWAEALPFFQRATAQDLHHANAWGNVGRILNELRRYEEALVADERSLALNDRQTWGWNNKGNALKDLKRSEEAVAAYDRALAINPNYALAWYNKGLALEHLKRYQEALTAYDRGFDRKNPQHWRAHARIYRALGRVAEAEEAERQAKALGG
jgi:tetratricopeptide (TPR) repeat protein